MLCFIVNGESAEDKKGDEERMSGSSVTKDRPLGNQKTAEKGIRLEEGGAIYGEHVNIGSFGYVLCQAACVLGANGWVCITK